MTALLCLAEGTSLINETVFESRYKHAFELMRMGADIIVTQDGKSAFITGVPSLKGTTVESRDLRGGAALILAGLAADGLTIVTNSKHIERGYEKIEDELNSLGANIQYIS